MFKHSGTLVFLIVVAVILANIAIVFKTYNTRNNQLQNIPDKVEQDLSKLLVTDLTTKIVKCNFTGTYQVTQDYVNAINGASCNDFKPRTLIFDNVISVCSRYLDSNQELFLNCLGTDNPVRKCDGIVVINVAETRACEYWVFIRKID